MYHYKARAYLPQLGRFAQSDPILYAGGMNLYAYVQNDPVNLRDPWGLQSADADEIVVTGTRREPPITPMMALTWDSGGLITDTPFTLNPDGETLQQAEDAIIVTARRLPRSRSGGAAANADQSTPSIGEAALTCAASQFGVDELIGVGATVSGLPIVPKPFVTPGSSHATSIASVTSRSVFGGARFPGGARVWAPTWVQPLGRTAFVGRAVGRLVPVLGAAILAYDAVSIAICTANTVN